MKDYETYYKPRRLQLTADIGPVSAGLQPRVMFSGLPGQKELDLITFTSETLMMGGSYLWEPSGETREHPETGSRIPVFSPPVLLDISAIYPIYERPHLGIQLVSGFVSIVERVSKTVFTVDDESSESIGGGLIDANFGKVARPCKIEMRDLTGTGYPDIIVGENNWDDYWPKAVVNGREISARWSSEHYRPFNPDGSWRGGLLHGRVFVFENVGEDLDYPGSYKFAPGQPLANVDQYGFCTPVFGDFTGDGLEDMICGSFLHDLKFFKRVDTSGVDFPKFALGIPLLDASGTPIKMRGVINYLMDHDLSGNGRLDLVIGSENGYITLLENLGELDTNGAPRFASEYFLLQKVPPLKADVLAVPAVGNLRGISKTLDMIVGDAGGFFTWFADLSNPEDRGHIPKIARVLPPYIQRGSIQGPSEIGWGYVCPTLFDWTGNSLLDMIFSDINGDHSVCVNEGTVDRPDFSSPISIHDSRTEKPLVTVWRVRPALSRDNSGALWYWCLDEDARLTAYKKTGPFSLEKTQRLTTKSGSEITFTKRFGGGRGRDKFQLFDWTGNECLDLLVGFPAGHDLMDESLARGESHFPLATVAILENTGTIENPRLEPPRYLKLTQTGEPPTLGHHSCSPEAYRLDGEVYLLVGCEDGQVYRFKQEEFL